MSIKSLLVGCFLMSLPGVSFADPDFPFPYPRLPEPIPPLGGLYRDWICETPPGSFAYCSARGYNKEDAERNFRDFCPEFNHILNPSSERLFGPNCRPAQ